MATMCWIGDINAVLQLFWSKVIINAPSAYTHCFYSLLNVSDLVASVSIDISVTYQVLQVSHNM